MGAGALASIPQKAIGRTADSRIQQKQMEQDGVIENLMNPGAAAAKRTEASQVSTETFGKLSVSNAPKIREKLPVTFLAASTVPTTNFNNFQSALSDSDNKTAADTFSKLSPEEKSEVLYSFINKYEEKEKNALDDSGLIKEMLTSKLEEIAKETDPTRKTTLETNLKTYLTQQELTDQNKLVRVFNTNSAYQDIIKKLLGTTTTPPAPSQTPTAPTPPIP